MINFCEYVVFIISSWVILVGLGMEYGFYEEEEVKVGVNE